MSKLIEGEDFYYDESGKLVFTEEYLLNRGFCCNYRCKHCPYKKVSKKYKNALIVLTAALQTFNLD